MAQKPSELPEQFRVTELGGVNERVSPALLKPGEFSYLEGLYPSQNGLLSRVPGKVLLATLPGGTNILQITQTFNSRSHILFHTDSGRFAYTLDELFNRQTIPNLTPGTVPGTNTNEEAMSAAIILQQEASAVPGGSLSGFISGTDATSLINTFYGRRLTSCQVNESSTLVSFTASTGGSGAVSTPGQFVLAPGNYRISAWFLVGGSSTTASVAIGLWNATNSQFQTNVGGFQTGLPIMATPVVNSALSTYLHAMEGVFSVTGSNNTFQINQECSVQTAARLNTFGGQASALTSANVNGSALLNTYGFIKILKEP